MRTIVVWSAFLALAHVCRAETIIISSTDPSMTPGLPADELELQGLGIDPGSFLFTGNTQYDFNGLENLQIIGGVVNSEDNSIVMGTAQTIVAMGDVTMGDVTMGDSSGSTSALTSAAPEPGAFSLCAAGLTFLFGLRLLAYRRSGASFSYRSRNCATASSSARIASSGIALSASRR